MIPDRSAVPLRASLAVLLLFAACSRQPEGWIPVMEETSTVFLYSEVDGAARAVQAASEALPDDPERAQEALEAASRSLSEVLGYYLPLVEAREHAYNAYRHFHLAERAKTAQNLDDIERLLMQVAAAGQGTLLVEMEESLLYLETARVALDSDSEDTSQALEALATRLNLLLLKGELALEN